MTIRSTLVTAWVAVLAWALVACGWHTQSQGPPAAPARSSTSPSPTGRSPRPTPTLQAKVHQQITLKVTSDATDELHVHSTPDHKFQVAAAPNQTFQFSVDVPGNVEVELHHLDRTIATIQVQP